MFYWKEKHLATLIRWLAIIVILTLGEPSLLEAIIQYIVQLS